MGHIIHVSEDTMSRLKSCAEPFIDKEPEDVIRRLLDTYEKPNGRGSRSANPSRQTQDPTISRVPRERGVVVELDGHRIAAVSVRDLYGQALRVLVDNRREILDKVLPFKTSDERYLLAKKPIHPSGNPFVMPAPHNGYHGYYMESHKDYKNATAHLQLLARKLDLKFLYIG